MFGLLRAFVPCSVFQYIYHGDNFMCFRVCFSQCLPFNEIGLCLFCILVVCGVAAFEGMLPFIFGCYYYLCGMGFTCSDLASYPGLFFFQLRCLACLLSSYCPDYNFVTFCNLLHYLVVVATLSLLPVPGVASLSS